MQYNNKKVNSNEVIRMNPERIEAMCGGKGHVADQAYSRRKRDEWKVRALRGSDSGAGVFPWLP